MENTCFEFVARVVDAIGTRTKRTKTSITIAMLTRVNAERCEYGVDDNSVHLVQRKRVCVRVFGDRRTVKRNKWKKFRQTRTIRVRVLVRVRV